MIPPAWSDLLLTRLKWGTPQTIGDLAESMGAPRRAIEKAVEELRASGSPIVTGSQGVWLTTSPEELRGAYRALRRRYIHQAVGARVLLETARRFEKPSVIVQTSLFGDAA